MAACKADRVELRSEKGRTAFSVELADTAQERAQGLMYRKKMAAGAGMLFAYPSARDDIAFWMKNTYIPLDIIFISPQGRVMRLHENAKPHDQTALPGGNDIQYVLEINAGLARQLGIKPGSLLRHPLIKDPLWPC